MTGAELFTGNNLIVMAWASGRIGLKEVSVAPANSCIQRSLNFNNTASHCFIKFSVLPN